MTHFRSRLTGRASRAVLLGAASALALVAVDVHSSPALAQATCVIDPGGGDGGANADGTQSFACGPNAIADGDFSTAIGHFSEALGVSSTAVGYVAQAWGDHSTAVGAQSFANGFGATALGKGSRAEGEGATAVGHASKAVGEGATAVGHASNADGEGAVAVGEDSYADGDGAIAIGENSHAHGDSSMALGRGAQGNGADSVALGRGAQANGNGSLAFGRGARAEGDGSVAIGRDSAGGAAVATMPNEFALGTARHTYTAAGITSLESRQRQQGPLEVVTSDANGHLATDGGLLFEELSKLGGGVAIAMALENPDLVGNERFGLAGNVAFWEDNVALGFTAMGVLGHNFLGAGERWALSGGVGFTIKEESYGGRSSQSSVGGRAGLQITW